MIETVFETPEEDEHTALQAPDDCDTEHQISTLLFGTQTRCRNYIRVLTMHTK